jgi:hypothetical protein
MLVIGCYEVGALVATPPAGMVSLPMGSSPTLWLPAGDGLFLTPRVSYPRMSGRSFPGECFSPCVGDCRRSVWDRSVESSVC